MVAKKPKGTNISRTTHVAKKDGLCMFMQPTTNGSNFQQLGGLCSGWDTIILEEWVI